ncbi:DUF1853 family protein [Psychroserpens damuponensis]|uniref:DUF1853 family protein n=1 Tax=Psychroserpens damuponensis TaxID=943936 RepID=UPI00058CF25F|nr:DUF1853 family protein [Psychroserpens damuponensis]
MNISPQHLQSLYQAYCKTQLLWKNAAINNLQQFELSSTFDSVFLRKLDKQLRLGQLAEQFVFNQLDTAESTNILAENIQIQKNKRTLGELDTLLLVNEKAIHLEIVYKFYVYDATAGPHEIDRWIGPNRKDSLVDKLNKLQHKQLPLLYTDDCQLTLKQLALANYNFKQQVLFKAQLFIPYQEHLTFKLINKHCVCGFFIKTSQLEVFKHYQFYIPSKLDWFLEPHATVDWLEFSNFRSESQTFLNQKQSPLYWMKNDLGDLFKCFLVWW